MLCCGCRSLNLLMELVDFEYLILLSNFEVELQLMAVDGTLSFEPAASLLRLSAQHTQLVASLLRLSAQHTQRAASLLRLSAQHTQLAASLLCLSAQHTQLNADICR